jgi:hypothetical protein
MNSEQTKNQIGTSTADVLAAGPGIKRKSFKRAETTV